MAIKVIRHGNKIFTAVCPICGCEFEYEVEDLTEEADKESLTYGATIKTVKCPECGGVIKHKEYTTINPTPIYPSQPWIYPKYPDIVPNWPNNWPWITWTTGTGTELDCDKCPNKLDPLHPVVGDTPCTWCKKNQPYCYTGDKFPADYKGGSTSSGSYSVNPKDFKDCKYTNYTSDLKK